MQYPNLHLLAVEAAPAHCPDNAAWAASAIADMEDYLGDCTGQGDVLATPAQLAALDAALAGADMHGVWASNPQALAAVPAAALPVLGHVLDALEEFGEDA